MAGLGDYSAIQRQTTVAVYLNSKQLPLLVFARQYSGNGQGHLVMAVHHADPGSRLHGNQSARG